MPVSCTNFTEVSFHMLTVVSTFKTGVRSRGQRDMAKLPVFQETRNFLKNEGGGEVVACNQKLPT